MRTAMYIGMDEAYYAILAYCREFGQRSEHRGGPCKELRPFSFTLHNPSEGLFTGAPRRLNYRFWAVETLCYLAGWGDKEAQKCAELLIKLNSNYANFARKSTIIEKEFGPNGSVVVQVKRTELYPMVRYGDALGPGLTRCYDTLKAKPSSRQAYVSIHDRDTPHTHEDLPCGASVQYFTTDLPDGPALSALYNIRSNDLGWGVPYDVATNCCLQWTLAGALGMQLGQYHHVAGSMHYYEANGRTPLRPPDVSPPNVESWLAAPPRIPHPTHVCDIRQYQRWADGLLRETHHHFVVSERPGADFCPSLKGDMANGEAWIRQWVDVIRWRHPK